MAVTTTYSLEKPTVGADDGTWGTKINGVLDDIDDLLDGTTPVDGIDIDGGTIDGTVIGGTTPGPGTFTTVTTGAGGNPASSASDVGVSVNANGLISAAKDAGVALSLGRQTSDGFLTDFRRGGSVVGTISVTATATAYNTSSDYRLKEDVQPVADATSKILALAPRNFRWKADNTRSDGFLAHEVQAVIPNAVTGDKDAVDGEGNPIMQGIDHSKIVPLLTAALQEALARIDALEGA